MFCLEQYLTSYAPVPSETLAFMSDVRVELVLKVKSIEQF